MSKSIRVWLARDKAGYVIYKTPPYMENGLWHSKFDDCIAEGRKLNELFQQNRFKLPVGTCKRFLIAVEEC